MFSVRVEVRTVLPAGVVPVGENEAGSSEGCTDSRQIPPSLQDQLAALQFPGCWYSFFHLTRAGRVGPLGASWSLLPSKEHCRWGHEASSLLCPHPPQ